MQPAGQGVWQARVHGDWNGRYYVYALQFDGTEGEVLSADPYARACGINGRRSMVIDLAAAAPDGWADDRRPDIPPHARAVWETHVADFSADPGRRRAGGPGGANFWALRRRTPAWTATRPNPPA